MVDARLNHGLSVFTRGQQEAKALYQKDK
jgi:hypothetical protein